MRFTDLSTMRDAVEHLRIARNLLASCGASTVLERVRSALQSAEVAARHTQRLNSRAFAQGEPRCEGDKPRQNATGQPCASELEVRQNSVTLSVGAALRLARTALSPENRNLPAERRAAVTALAAAERTVEGMRAAASAAIASLDSLLTQTEQVAGMFPDEDRCIRNAMDDAESAIDELRAARKAFDGVSNEEPPPEFARTSSCEELSPLNSG